MFDFGNRKIIGVNYSRYVALPKTWLNAMGLDAHSKIEMKMNDDQELVLKPVGKCAQDIVPVKTVE